jgi:DNA-directed RNA polymerase subunit RPC12/RpoP
MQDGDGPTVFPPSIRSRPVYGQLHPRPGSAHLMVADGAGARALTGMLDRPGAAREAMLARAHLIYMPGPDGSDEWPLLLGLGAAQAFRAPDFAAALPRLRRVLAEARMGTRVYAAGTEGLIGRVVREAMAAGFPHGAVQTEHRGSTVRRVQCVHCKGITENVATDPFRCVHCGLHLFVRDHYSRRIAAFQGVNIDAEDPGRVPSAVERFR